jgi:hypothetical protein
MPKSSRHLFSRAWMIKKGGGGSVIDCHKECISGILTQKRSMGSKRKRRLSSTVFNRESERSERGDGNEKKKAIPYSKGRKLWAQNSYRARGIIWPWGLCWPRRDSATGAPRHGYGRGR